MIFGFHKFFVTSISGLLHVTKAYNFMLDGHHLRLPACPAKATRSLNPGVVSAMIAQKTSQESVLGPSALRAIRELLPKSQKSER